MAELESEGGFPQFAALSCCLLIDSSFRSRREVIKDIKATALFEEIIEAQSLPDAFERLKGRSFDACFLGPSLQIEATASFLERAKEVSKANDCAFVLIYRAAVETTAFVQESPAHSVVVGDATKRAFSEATIRAVLLACENSPWPGVRLDQDGSLLVKEGDIWRKVSSEPPRPVRSTPASLPSGVGQELLASLEVMDEEDSTSNELLRLLRKVLESPLPVDDGTDEARFARYVFAAVEEWKEEAKNLGAKDAGRNLRRKLQGYAPTSE
ncbi:MAG: hypothetical protein KDD69_02610 [Bdellovibrionales bacterium]|nr:hypothetical protein [Bdellovibrionales bacterium]